MQSFENLCRWFESLDGVMVAVSGGVDSALVAAAAYKTLGSAAIAVTADYKTLSKEELDSAKSICKQIGIRHTMLISSYKTLHLWQTTKLDAIIVEQNYLDIA